MNRQDELRNIIADARNELGEYESQERFDSNAKFVGRHYRYHNSYGSSRPRWWLYTKVTGLSEGGSLQGYSFQNDGDGRIEIEVGGHVSESTLGEVITEKEFESAKTSLLRDIGSAVEEQSRE